MRIHGKGPRRVLVKRYPRWEKGYRKYVAKHCRGLTPLLSVRPTPKQLVLDLEGPGPT
jgi:hypothetical protein